MNLTLKSSGRINFPERIYWRMCVNIAPSRSINIEPSSRWTIEATYKVILFKVKRKQITSSSVSKTLAKIHEGSLSKVDRVVQNDVPPTFRRITSSICLDFDYFQALIENVSKNTTRIWKCSNWDTPVSFHFGLFFVLVAMLLGHF